MAKQILLLLLFALVVESRLAKSSSGKPRRPQFAGPPPFNPPPPPPPSFTNFSRTNFSGRASNVFPSWTRLDCDMYDPSSPTESHIKGSVIMVINNDYLYFFYDKFVISMAPPRLQKAFSQSKLELTDKDIELVTTRPVYAYHTSKNDGYNYLTSPDGFRRVKDDFAGSMEFLDSNGGKSTYLILDASNERAKAAQIFWLDFRQDSYGWLSLNDENPKTHKRRKHEKSFVRFDYVKWFELVYNEYAKSLDIYYWHPGKKVWLGDPMQRTEGYLLNGLVYWDNHIIARKDYGDDHWLFNLWWSSVVELDENNMLHFHTYVFKISENDGELAAVAHYSYDMRLIDFLDCQPKDGDYELEKGNQLKGVIFSHPKDYEFHTLVFIDQFYFVVKLDLLAKGFNLFGQGVMRKAFKVEFESGDLWQVPVDLISTKYVKHVVFGGKRAPQVEQVFAFDQSQTYRIIRRDFDLNAPIKLQKSSEILAKCPYSTLTFVKLSSVTFCFDKQEYYLLTSDNDMNELRTATAHRIPIEKIFIGSNVDYSGEDIELVFDYVNLPEYTERNAVFMTYNWLLVFDKYEAFEIDEEGRNLEETEIKLKKQVLEPALFNRTQNCLWTRCR